MSDGGIDRHIFGSRVWANKDARETLNRASKAIKRQEPDYVEDPCDPSLDEVLTFLQEEEGESRYVDDGIFTNLMGSNLSYRQMVYWYLYAYCGLEVTEILCAEKDIKRLKRHELHRQELRNIGAQITAVTQTLETEVEPDWEFLESA